MPLRLVLGPANAAKAGEVLGAFAAAGRRGAILVVPTAVDVRHYTRELAADGVLLGTVTTFPGLARTIAERAGYEARVLSATQRERVLRRAIARLQLSAFAESAPARGFPVAAGGLIAELERGLVTPQRFTSALRTWALEDERRAAHAEDLAAIYSAYARELERGGWVDGELFAWRALDALRVAPGAWGGTPVFFYGFDDLTGLERDAIETLSRVVDADVVVSLTYESGRAALGARAGTVEDLRPIAAAIEELPALDTHYAPGSRDALHHVERTLFEPDRPEPIDPGDAVVLLEVGGERAEAELIAAEVLALLRSGRCTPGEIVVVCRSVAHTAPLLERVLRRFGVPCATARSGAFAGTTLGRSLLALARCARDCAALGASELLRYLRAPGLLDAPELADALEFAGLRAGATSAAQLRAAAGRAAAGWTAEDRAVFSPIDELAASAEPASALLGQARRLFAAPRRGRAATLDAAEAGDARALAALARAIDECAVLGEVLTLGELIEVMETLELPDAGGNEAAVLIAEPLAIRARRFAAVLVCGLCEGEFPRPATPEPFLSDERRRELAIASGLVLGGREDGLAAERYLFYSAASRATERLVLSYRSSDEEGNLVLASPFVADVAELFVPDWFTRRRRRLLADVTFPGSAAPTERERVRTEQAAIGRAAPPTAADMAPRQLGERALAHMRHNEVVSGGALETYADCPMKWLVDRQLAPVEMAPDADPLTRGSYMHEALEQLFRQLDGPLAPDTLPRAEGLLDEILAGLDSSSIGPGRPASLRRAMLQAIAADLHRYLRHEAAGEDGYRTRDVELRFGFTDDPESLPPLRLADDVVLRGVIDRVDVAADGRSAIVRDYKSGSYSPDYQANYWREEHQLQVGLYMLVVRELLGLEPVAGFYQPLRGRELRARGVYRTDRDVGDFVYDGDGREPDELTALLDELAEDAVQITRRLRAGVLTPSPHSCSRDGCRFPGICRSS